ncbi:MAG: hypothetical protein F6K17_26070 [Okeania sp. SIO3C4]|nr:hypothetical protein [Okeania sp. SIO3B3]NER05811.1 hypothetical protein [Okeania sp. SIO3C4]
MLKKLFRRKKKEGRRKKEEGNKFDLKFLQAKNIFSLLFLGSAAEEGRRKNEEGKTEEPKKKVDGDSHFSYQLSVISYQYLCLFAQHDLGKSEV